MELRDDDSGGAVTRGLACRLAMTAYRLASPRILSRLVLLAADEALLTARPLVYCRLTLRGFPARALRVEELDSRTASSNRGLQQSADDALNVLFRHIDQTVAIQ